MVNANAELLLTPDALRHARLFRRIVALSLLMLLLMAVADVPVSRWVHDRSFSPWVRHTLAVLRLPGNYLFTVLIAVLIVWPFRRDWRISAELLGSGAAASIVTAVLKWCFGRSRPFRGRPPFHWHPFPCLPWDSLHTKDLSFPSGDSTLAFATAAVIAAEFPRLRWLAYGWALVVAATRVLQGVHYPGDVAGGALVGTVVAELIARKVRTRADSD